MKLEEIRSLLESKIQGCMVEEDLDATPPALVVQSVHIHQVCSFLYENQSTYFDLLSCLSALDNGPERETMEVIYNLYSIPYDHHLMLKVSIPREKPAIDSVSTIWKTADWHEREAYDLLGITFNGHPDLRRILLPEDWEGFPLRKDYEEQEIYHDVKVKY